MVTRTFKKLICLCICISLSACVTQTPKPGDPAVSGIVEPIHENLAIDLRSKVEQAKPIPGFMRGVNLGNFLDSPKGTNWRSESIGAEHLKHVAKLGFDHVRFPVRFADYTEERAPYRIDPELLKKVDMIIELAFQYELGVVLDLHHFEKLMADPKGQESRSLAIWEQLAQRYKHIPDARLAFEPINEPMDKLEGDTWNQLANKLIQTIRKSNPERLIIINSGFWAAASRLPLLKLPPVQSDPNILASFHMYEPFLFTHQGASWTSPIEMTANLGIVFPGPANHKIQVPRNLDKNLEWVSNWISEYNSAGFQENPSGYKRIAEEFAYVDALIKEGRRIYLGEFGAIEFADPRSRVNYVRMIREEAERRNLAWCYWDDGGAFKLIDLKKGDVVVLRDALLPKSKDSI